MIIWDCVAGPEAPVIPLIIKVSLEVKEAPVVPVTVVGIGLVSCTNTGLPEVIECVKPPGIESLE